MRDVEAAEVGIRRTVNSFVMMIANIICMIGQTQLFLNIYVCGLVYCLNSRAKAIGFFKVSFP